METETPFAEVPSDVNTVVALVRREAMEECHAGACVVRPVLETCVRDAVSELWDSRIKTFIPLLSLRRVRYCIRVGTCDTDIF